MSDYAELKKSAEQGEDIPCWHAITILDLIAENEKLSARDSDHVRQFNELSDFRQKTVERFDAKVSALEAESESLRKVAMELRRFASCENLHHDKPDQHEADEPCKVLARIDAAMSKEPKAE